MISPHLVTPKSHGESNEWIEILRRLCHAKVAPAVQLNVLYQRTGKPSVEGDDEIAF